MKKSDLVNGIVVKIRKDRELYLVYNDRIVSHSDYINLRNYTEDLINKECRDFDIISVGINDNVFVIGDILEKSGYRPMWMRSESVK